jgi:hypothetical protein
MVDLPPTAPTFPAAYYRRLAARVRQLASETTTSAMKRRLLAAALEYERLAKRLDSATAATDC